MSKHQRPSFHTNTRTLVINRPRTRDYHARREIWTKVAMHAPLERVPKHKRMNHWVFYRGFMGDNYS